MATQAVSGAFSVLTEAGTRTGRTMSSCSDSDAESDVEPASPRMSLSSARVALTRLSSQKTVEHCTKTRRASLDIIREVSEMQAKVPEGYEDIVSAATVSAIAGKQLAREIIQDTSGKQSAL